MTRFFSIMFLGLMCTASWAADKPNIILIMADDVGIDGFSSYGSASYQTPNLDRLAAQGMRFTHCYSQPLCTPSRVQIMTGRYNSRNYANFGVLNPEEKTFGHMLQDAGYATAVTGKWQLFGTDSRDYKMAGKGTHPLDAGFDTYRLWQVERKKNFGERYADPFLDEHGKELTTHEGAYGPDLFTDFIIDFIKANQDGPFFVYYPMALVHDPFVPTPDSEGWEGDRYAKDTKYFAHMVSYMDKVVGRIAASLEELGLAENTLLLFTSDNGTKNNITSKMKDGRTIVGDKGKPTDAGTHVPLIAWQPGTVKAGVVNDNLIDFSDVLPTLADWAGTKPPADREIDGVSFAHQLRGEDGPVRDWIFCHYAPKWGGRDHTRFARDHRWKLYEDGRLFDVPNDPLEQKPVSPDASTDDMRAVRTKLQAVLDRYATN